MASEPRNPNLTAQKQMAHPKSKDPYHRTIKSSEMESPCLILHLPSYTGVQEALQFLDISVRRVLHLESFL